LFNTHLALLTTLDLNDTEVWRTSTAEPTKNGIIWTYSKDVSNYLSLWQQHQKIIFDLGNLIDDTYTGSYNTTLSAVFFTTEDHRPAADVVVPISKRLSGQDQPSAYQIPQQGPAKNSLAIPRNVQRAIFTISACGQADEEFWWSNVPNSTTQTFGKNNTLTGYSPWREAQLWIDDKLAGVAWPFPIIFTGGVVPGFWRPVVGIDAYDLREDEIDISPWLPLLSDGKAHSYEIRVVGLVDGPNGDVKISPVGNYWIVTGKLFLWLDQSGNTTAGTPPTVLSPPPSFSVESSISKSGDGKNETLTYKVTASREFVVTGSVTTSEGARPVEWRQSLSFSNTGNVSANGSIQANEQLTSGVDRSLVYHREVNYPLKCASSFTRDPTTNAVALSGKIVRGQKMQVSGITTFPSGLEGFAPSIFGPVSGFIMDTTQEGDASFASVPKGNTTGKGSTSQDYMFTRIYGITPGGPVNASPEPPEDIYGRRVSSENGKITRDLVRSLEEYNPTEEPPIRTGAHSKFEDVQFDLADLQRAVGARYRAVPGMSAPQQLPL
jgi:Peptide N-acetyl-beta-D-glucosaminyl asparaginase amidase A